MGWSAVVRVCVLDGRVNEWRGGSGRAGWKGKRTSGRGFRGEWGKQESGPRRGISEEMKGEMGRRGGKGPATSSLRREQNGGFEGRVDCAATDVVCCGQRLQSNA